MRLYVQGRTIVVEAEPIECAIFAALMMHFDQEILKKKQEDEAAKELDLAELFSKMTFEELLKREQGDGGEQPEGGAVNTE